jgi:uncharacterized membrane protein YfcA
VEAPVHTVELAALALLTAGFGALGGLGGAVLLVPALVVTGMSPAEAAPLGLFSVAAGSLAAAAPQLQERVVHHRLGVTTELAASSGAIAGALAAGAASDTALRLALAATALLGAAAGARRRGVRNPARPGYGEEHLGEWPGSLAGAYPVLDGIAPYRARRVPAGLLAMTGAGVMAGLAGVSGGFVKTPATTEIMHVPVKVAAGTTTFTIGITAATALVVFALQGRIDLDGAAAVVISSLMGAVAGTRLQRRLSPPVVRRALALALAAVAVVLVVTA